MSIVIQTRAASEKGLWEPDKSWSKVGHKSYVGSILLISHTHTHRERRKKKKKERDRKKRR